jgi:glycosyltransferase involved in cell wall biosynthesis
MDKPQRVLITFDTHTPYLAFRVRELQRELERRGWQDRVSLEVVLVALEETSYQWDAGTLSELYGGVPVRALTDKFRGLGFRTWFKWTTIKTTFALLKHYCKRRPNVTFAGGYDRPESMIMALASIFTRGRVGVLHDSRFNDAESYSKSIWLEFAKALMMRRYDFFMCPGRECAEYSRFLGGGKKPTYLGGWDVVDNAHIAKLAEDDGNDEAIRQHLGVSADESYFFMPIRFIPKKNTLLVLRAFAKCHAGLIAAGLPPVRLIICGQGPCETEYRTEITRLGLEDWIHLRPWLPYHQVPRANRLALALLLASTHDQWGMTINEALAAGAPVLCSSRAGAHEVVRNHVNGYTFHPWDEAHLAELLYAMAASPNLVERLRGNAANSVRDFSVVQWLDACFAEIKAPRS